MLEGERLACDGRQCFAHFYYIIIGIGPSILVNDSSAHALDEAKGMFLSCDSAHFVIAFTVFFFCSSISFIADVAIKRIQLNEIISHKMPISDTVL